MSKYMLGIAVRRLVTLPECTLGVVCDLLEKLSDPEWVGEAKKFLRKEATWVKVDLMAYLNEVSVPAVKKFVAAKAFVLDTSATAKVKIGYLGENFKANFLNTVEKNIPSTTLAIHHLVKNSLNQPILDQLGDKAYTSLSQFYYLLSQQPEGEAGTLLTNGYANVFYIKDENGKTGVVYADWSTDCCGWGVDAGRMGGPAEWVTEYQFFSRK